MSFYKVSLFSRFRMFSLLSGLNDLPRPKKLSYFWKMGSLLGSFLGLQIITGLFLSFHYVSDNLSSFGSVDSLFREVSYGWLFRFLHVAGARRFFLLMYLHVGRGLYYYSFTYYLVWLSGCVILVLRMAVGFLGYVLPWGQMSYWGATVITKFFSVIPYIGTNFVVWVWGSFSVDYPTLTRFFSLHFLAPFIIFRVFVAHTMFLHESGSKNPLGLSSKGDKILFTPYFGVKDIFGIFIFFLFICFFICFPEGFMEYQNFIEAKALVTPTHIQPEWYFLGAYAVLRCIPKKLGGVIGLVLYVLIFFIFPFLTGRVNRGFKREVIYQFFFWLWVANVGFLTWLGSQPVEEPYGLWSQVCSIYYFGYFLIYF